MTAAPNAAPVQSISVHTPNDFNQAALLQAAASSPANAVHPTSSFYGVILNLVPVCPGAPGG
ncbi:MAG: hypothetical protein EPN91_09030 [Salinibacterium sp.]|nr:MAG: hypothetical protein EPN91_09030 [Salinibacterium sp.]